MTSNLHEAVAVFEQHRPRLLGIAYRVLGRAADAEDVVREVWLRRQKTDRSALQAGAAGVVVLSTGPEGAPLRPAVPRRRAAAIAAGAGRLLMHHQIECDLHEVARHVPTVVLPTGIEAWPRPWDFGHSQRLISTASHAAGRFLDALRVSGPGPYRVNGPTEPATPAPAAHTTVTAAASENTTATATTTVTAAASANATATASENTTATATATTAPPTSPGPRGASESSAPGAAL
ncbi:sigma factor [Streptomyces sp. NPDC096153]|uniref:sigma factor n=1 Tax=Streptomyces sp. NPDC096153 TaxID=3155548 RepID=UPI003323FD29